MLVVMRGAPIAWTRSWQSLIAAKTSSQSPSMLCRTHEVGGLNQLHSTPSGIRRCTCSPIRQRPTAQHTDQRWLSFSFTLTLLLNYPGSKDGSAPIFADRHIHCNVYRFGPFKEWSLGCESNSYARTSSEFRKSVRLRLQPFMSQSYCPRIAFVSIQEL